MPSQVTAASSDGGQEDGWVVCRVFKKKHHHKESSSGGGGKHHGDSKAAAAHGAHGGGLQYSSSDEALDQILHYMGRSCKQEHELLSPPQQARPAGSRYLRPIDTVLAAGHGFMKLPPLESPSALLASAGETATSEEPLHRGGANSGVVTDWAMMDRLVASHLNGQPDSAPAAADQLCSFDGDASAVDGLAFYSAAATRLLSGSATGASDDDDLWSFARSAATSTTTDRLNHVTL